MPNYKRSKSQKKNGGSRNRSRSTRSAKRGGRRSTKSSRGGQRAKKNVMQRGGGVISWEKLGARLKEKTVLKTFYTPFEINPDTEWDTAVEGVFRKIIPNFNRESVDVSALLAMYKEKTAPISNTYVVAELTKLQTELQNPE